MPELKVDFVPFLVLWWEPVSIVREHLKIYTLISNCFSQCNILIALVSKYGVISSIPVRSVSTCLRPRIREISGVRPHICCVMTRVEYCKKIYYYYTTTTIIIIIIITTVLIRNSNDCERSSLWYLGRSFNRSQ